MTNYVGIDYGMGKTNINKETEIRYGVIPEAKIEFWYEKSEAYYGEACCPKCGNEAKESKGKYRKYEHAKHECNDYVCHDCKYCFGSESAFSDEVLSFSYKKNGYICFQSGGDNDIFIELSPYFTYAQFCSPCAPGACYLLNPLNQKIENNRCYCFGHSWFKNNKASYPVYSVKTGKQILAVEENVPCHMCKGTGKRSTFELATIRNESNSKLESDIENGLMPFIKEFDKNNHTFKCNVCNGIGTIKKIIEKEME